MQNLIFILFHLLTIVLDRKRRVKKYLQYSQMYKMTTHTPEVLECGSQQVLNFQGLMIFEK